MPIKSQLICGALFVSVVMFDNIKTKIKAKQAAELYLASHEAFDEIRRANEAQITYLCHMLDENGVPADEFDLIALHYHQ
jgi:hypothetical protein